MNKKIFIDSNSCIRRKFDSLKIVKYLEINKCDLVTDPQEADYIFLGTCAAIEEKADESFEYIEKYSKFSGELIVVGCLPEMEPVKFKQRFHGRFLSTDNLEKIDEFFSDFKIKFKDMPDVSHYRSRATQLLGKLRSYLHKYSGKKEIAKDYVGRVKKSLSKELYMAKFLQYDIDKYAYLRIATGCNGHCTFCVIPQAIGRISSKPIQACVSEYKDILAQGFRKIVISGDDVGAYGIDSQSSFSELLDQLTVASENRTIRWCFQNLHPKWAIKYKKELLKVAAQKRIEAVNFPIHSGSNRILKLMNRYYNIEETIELLSEIKKADPDIIMETDLIIGFPSETEGEFHATLDVVKKMRFNKAYVNPYSDRESSSSSRMEHKTDQAVITKRLNAAIDFCKNEGIDVP